MHDPERSEAYLKMAVRAANIGRWSWDVATGAVAYSSEWKRQLGYADEEIGDTFSEWESRVHPEDLAEVKARIAHYFEHPQPHYEAEFRMRHKDGSWRWIFTQADILRDPEGRPLHMLGCHVDVTDRKRAELGLRRANRMLRLISDSNQALLRLGTETELLRRVCEIVVTTGGYRLVWVQLLAGDAAH